MEKTPLSMAVENGHEAAVRLLIESGDVDINTTNNREKLKYTGRTSHLVEIHSSHWQPRAGIRLLCCCCLHGRDDVDINAKDCRGGSIYIQLSLGSSY